MVHIFRKCYYLQTYSYQLYYWVNNYQYLLKKITYKRFYSKLYNLFIFTICLHIDSPYRGLLLKKNNYPPLSYWAGSLVLFKDHAINLFPTSFLLYWVFKEWSSPWVSFAHLTTQTHTRGCVCGPPTSARNWGAVAGIEPGPATQAAARSSASRDRTGDPWVLSPALYHWAIW